MREWRVARQVVRNPPTDESQEPEIRLIRRDRPNAADLNAERGGSEREGLDDLGGRAVFADHRPTGFGPVEHAAVEVHRVSALSLQVLNGLRGTAADLAHDQSLAVRDLAHPGRNLCQGDA